MSRPALELPTDIHVHIQPWEMMRPASRRAIRRGRDDHDVIERLMSDPAALPDWLDEMGLGRVGLINYVAPEIMGFTAEVNPWVVRYREKVGERVIAFGGIHPPACDDVVAEMKYLLDELRLDAIKIHPPHQDLSAAGHRDGSCPGLGDVYAACEERGVPVMVHTGTSIFPGARSRRGEALDLDDVAVDFPDLRIIMAHGGRPLWMDQAFFLLRRHRNVYFDISGIPPRRLLEWFPRLEEIAGKTLFGTDWPSPGVRRLRANLDEVRALPLAEESIDRILRGTALELFPLPQ